MRKIWHYRDPVQGLGNQWALISWGLKMSHAWECEILISTMSGDVDYYDRMSEIVSLLDTDAGITLVREPGNSVAKSIWIYNESYIPTKVRHKGGSGFCYQFDGHSAAHMKNPPPDEMKRLIDWCDANGGERIGGGMSLLQCVEIASRSRFFLGVCSGMSHLCHSVGVPEVLIEYEIEIGSFHRKKEYTTCYGTLDAIHVASRMLEQTEDDALSAAYRESLEIPGNEYLPHIVDVAEVSMSSKAIEIGVRSGYGSIALLHAMSHENGTLVSIDSNITKLSVESDRWTSIKGDTLDPSVIAQLHHADLVLISDEYGAERTLEILETYRHLVTSGGTIVCRGADTDTVQGDTDWPIRRAVEQFCDKYQYTFTAVSGKIGLAFIRIV